MKKKLQVILSEEAWDAVERLCMDANTGFDAGSISYSNAINEMILTARVDIKALQLKHTNFRRSLRVLASRSNLDLDSAIRSLMELKSKTAKKRLGALGDEAASG